MSINYKNLEQLIQTEIQKERLMGAALMIYTDNEKVYDKAFGEYSENSIYRIYSMSKIITSISVFKLYEEGKLNLEDPVSKYFPEFEKLQVLTDENQVDIARNVMTIQHLLNMTSGLGYPNPMGTECEKRWSQFEKQLAVKLEKEEILSTSDICSMFAEIPCAFEPGSKWKYGASADLLGGIIEQVASMPLDEYLKKNIFEPLEMKDTDFYIPIEKIDRLAKMYRRDSAIGKVSEIPCKILNKPDTTRFTLPAVSRVRTVKPVFLSGGAGLYCPIQDYQNVLTMLLNKGSYKGKQLLKKSTVEFLSKNQLSQEMKDIMHLAVVGDNLQGYSYSNLVRIMQNPEDDYMNGCVGNSDEYGWDGLPGNYCLVDPRENMTVIFMMQVAEGADLQFRSNLRKLIYS